MSKGHWPSPILFMQFMTRDYSKQKLAESRSLLDTSFNTGLSGPGRLHDLFVTFEGMTPGEFKKQGAELEISHGFIAKSGKIHQYRWGTTRKKAIFGWEAARSA